MEYSKEDLWPYGEIEEFLPVLDDDWNCIESEADYVGRMKVILPHAPEEVLREWFFRQWNDLDHYAFLDFKTLRFERQAWPLAEIPGREAFADPTFCDDFSSTFDSRLKNPDDWLVHFMAREGTWNTPPLILDNHSGQWTGTEWRPLRSPYHLLEGHRRLSFLHALRVTGKAGAEHDVWVVSKTA